MGLSPFAEFFPPESELVAFSEEGGKDRKMMGLGQSGEL